MNRTSLIKGLDATAGAILCRLLSRWAFLTGRIDPPEETYPDPIRRVLVIRPGGMGDMVLLLPVLRAIEERYPDAAIDLICERRNLQVLGMAHLRANPLPYDEAPWRLLRHVTRHSYDVVVDTEQFHNFSAILGFLSRAPLRIGFKVNPHRNPLYTHLVNYELDGPEAIQFRRLVEPLALARAVKPNRGCLAGIPRVVPARLQDLTRRAAYSRGIAVLIPGSSTPYKQWPASSFVELGSRLHRDGGVAIVLIGNSREKALAEGVRQSLDSAGCPVESLAGHLSLPETAAVIRNARLVVGCDSGLCHLAVAFGTPSVALFGPSDPRKWGHQDGPHAVVRQPLPCSPCFIFGYHRPCRTHACMQRITVSSVVEACGRVLAAQGSPSAPAR